MPQNTPTAKTASAKPSLDHRVEFDAFLAGLNAKDRANIERHVQACETEEDKSHAENWKRVVTALATLAPHAVKIGREGLQFYIADGKYRMQVFALVDRRDGHLFIYCREPSKTLKKEGAPDTRLHKVPGTSSHLTIQSLDQSTINPNAVFKDMLGWNRKAICITLPANATPAQVEAAEGLCLKSAAAWG
jgi:hypothetical protein